MSVRIEGPTDEEVRAVLAKREGAKPDLLSEFDRSIVGSEAARLLLPLDHPVAMLERASMLEGLAIRLQELCRRNDLSVRSLMFDYRCEIRAAQKALNEVGAGSGRLRRVK